MESPIIKITATLYRYGYRSELWADVTNGRKWRELRPARTREIALGVWNTLEHYGLDTQVGEVIISAWSWNEWPYVVIQFDSLQAVVEWLLGQQSETKIKTIKAA